MAFSDRLSLRQRLKARYGKLEIPMDIIDIPVTGRIDSATVQHVEDLATRACSGDIRARDALYFSLQVRLDRIGWVLRPWPNTPNVTGIWDRDDVQQESWLVFMDLLESWDQSASFVPYLLARFAWRLRDRVLRGIGKSQTQYGTIRIPETMLAELLMASDGEQPESVAIARKMLEELIRQHAKGEVTPGELEVMLRIVSMQGRSALSSVVELPVDEYSLSQIDAA